MTESRDGGRVNRRGFLGLAGMSGFLLVLGGLVSLPKRLRFLRPPGAHKESIFASRCIKCHKCQEVCPTGAISTVLVTESAIDAGTPTMDYHKGYCTLCLKCTEVCPAGALAPVDKETVHLGLAQIDTSRCIAWTWQACTLCHDHCPNHAILLDEQRRPVIDANTCKGCGQCQYVCIASVARSYRGGGKAITVVPRDPA